MASEIVYHMRIRFRFANHTNGFISNFVEPPEFKFRCNKWHKHGGFSPLRHVFHQTYVIFWSGDVIMSHQSWHVPEKRWMSVHVIHCWVSKQKTQRDVAWISNNWKPHLRSIIIFIVINPRSMNHRFIFFTGRFAFHKKFEISSFWFSSDVVFVMQKKYRWPC